MLHFQISNLGKTFTPTNKKLVEKNPNYSKNKKFYPHNFNIKVFIEFVDSKEKDGGGDFSQSFEI